jgi:hypothetical protein
MAKRCDCSIPRLGTPNIMAPWILFKMHAVVASRASAICTQASFKTMPPRLCAMNMIGFFELRFQPPFFKAKMKLVEMSLIDWKEWLASTLES